MAAAERHGRADLQEPRGGRGNAAQGYILAHGKENKKRLKLRVTQGQYKLTYDLNTAGEYEVFPLQLGDGSYTVELFENVSGKKIRRGGQGDGERQAG